VKTSLRGAVEATEAGTIISILVEPASKVTAVARQYDLDIRVARGKSLQPRMSELTKRPNGPDKGESGREN
jgi:hypothetical protein